MNWQPGKIKRGDVIRVNLGVIHHYGIFVSEENVIAFGLPPVPENRGKQAEVSVLSTDIDTFACGKIVEVAAFTKEENKTKFSPDETVARATARIGETGYNLIHNNCEHFVNECALGVKYCSVEEDARKRWNNRPILDVYLARIDDSEPIKQVYPPERQKEIADCKNEKLKRLKYADWRLLKTALDNSFHLDFNSLDFSKTKNGKWLADGVFFSLTHTLDFVAVAVSNTPVGIDAEVESEFSARFQNNSEKLNALIKKVYTRAELKSADSVTPREFLEKWTLKEAIFKREGKGNYNPKKISAQDKNSAAFSLGDSLPLLSLAGGPLQRTRFYISENCKLTPIKGSKL